MIQPILLARETANKRSTMATLSEFLHHRRVSRRRNSTADDYHAFLSLSRTVLCLRKNACEARKRRENDAKADLFAYHRRVVVARDAVKKLYSQGIAKREHAKKRLVAERLYLSRLRLKTWEAMKLRKAIANAKFSTTLIAIQHCKEKVARSALLHWQAVFNARLLRRRKIRVTGVQAEAEEEVETEAEAEGVRVEDILDVSQVPNALALRGLKEEFLPHHSFVTERTMFESTYRFDILDRSASSTISRSLRSAIITLPISLTLPLACQRRRLYRQYLTQSPCLTNLVAPSSSMRNRRNLWKAVQNAKEEVEWGGNLMHLDELRETVVLETPSHIRLPFRYILRKRAQMEYGGDKSESECDNDEADPCGSTPVLVSHGTELGDDTSYASPYEAVLLSVVPDIPSLLREKQALERDVRNQSPTTSPRRLGNDESYDDNSFKLDFLTSAGEVNPVLTLDRNMPTATAVRLLSSNVSQAKDSSQLNLSHESQEIILLFCIWEKVYLHGLSSPSTDDDQYRRATQVILDRVRQAFYAIPTIQTYLTSFLPLAFTTPTLQRRRTTLLQTLEKKVGQLQSQDGQHISPPLSFLPALLFLHSHSHVENNSQKRHSLSVASP